MPTLFEHKNKFKLIYYGGQYTDSVYGNTGKWYFDRTATEKFQKLCTSLQGRRRYYEIGSFEITMVYDNSFKINNKNMFLGIDYIYNSQTGELGKVLKRNIKTDETGTYIVFSGYFTEFLMKHMVIPVDVYRIDRDTGAVNGTDLRGFITSFIPHYQPSGLGKPYGGGRVALSHWYDYIHHVSISSSDFSELSGVAYDYFDPEKEGTGTDIYDIITNILTPYGLAISYYAHFGKVDNQDYYNLDLIYGKKLSQNRTESNVKRFSFTINSPEDIKMLNFEEDISNRKTATYSAGQYAATSGWDGRWYDRGSGQSDPSRVQYYKRLLYNEAPDISIGDYNNLVKQVLNEHVKITNCSFEYNGDTSYYNPLNPHTYAIVGKCFDLGDLCAFEYQPFGLNYNMRVIGIDEIFEGGNFKIQLEMGDAKKKRF